MSEENTTVEVTTTVDTETANLAKEYDEAGIELPPDTVQTLEPVLVPEPVAPKVEAGDEKETLEPLQIKPEEPPKKRSIYQDLKETRQDVKTERELREQAEKERDDLKTQLESKAQTTEVGDELAAYAAEIGADPVALKRMQDIFLKGVPKPTVDNTSLEAFQQWQAANSKAIEAQSFEEEFKVVSSDIQKMFPEASTEEMGLIKTKLDELAHTEAFHDKELDYVVFKNQESLKALVSPKKHGIETKGRIDVTAPTFEFDPNADLTKMSEAQQAEWEKAYNQASKSDELVTDAQGKRLII